MSNIYPFDDRETIEEEARVWLVKLDADAPLSTEDAQALRAWAGRSPAHRAELQRLSAFWDDANILAELSIPLASPAKARPSNGLSAWLAGRLKALRGSPAALLASALGMTVVVALWHYPPSPGLPNGIYGTAIGELKVRELPDGSLIYLNTDSQVQVDYSANLRKLRLLRGEAHFQVAKNPLRPFDVYAGESLIQAVGTAFSVRMEDSIVKVTVSEGVVDLAAQLEQSSRGETGGLSEPRLGPASQAKHVKLGTLARGQSVTYDKKRLVKPGAGVSAGSPAGLKVEMVAENDLRRQLAWRDGFLVFKGDSLEYVIGEISRYTPVSITLADPKLGGIEVGGRFRIGDLEALFEVLEVSFGIQVTRLDDQRVVLTSSSG